MGNTVNKNCMKIETLEVAGIQSAIKGMRNPMNSWERADTVDGVIGVDDMALAKKLVNAGSEHSKFLRQIQVWADFNMPRYFFSEFDTYKFNTKNSCSTMHKLLGDDSISASQFIYSASEDMFIAGAIHNLNIIRMSYLEAKKVNANDIMIECITRAKRILPEGFLQMRTVNITYAELMNIYHQRKNHKLVEEWQDTFCRWCETLPYFRELCIDYKEGIK